MKYSIKEGFKNWTFNDEVHVWNDGEVRFVTLFPAPLSSKKMKTYYYRTDKGLEGRVAKLTRHFHNPIKVSE